MEPRNMEVVINGKRYHTEGATLIARGINWEGHSYIKHGKHHFLFRTPKGNYFTQHQFDQEGVRDWLEPMLEGEARLLYQLLPERLIPFSLAFPEGDIQDA